VIIDNNEITNSSFTSNSSSDFGGAIYGSANILNSLFIGNSARNGGAFYLTGPSELIGLTVVDNFTTSSTGKGSAIYSTAPLKVAYSVFDNNHYAWHSATEISETSLIDGNFSKTFQDNYYKIYLPTDGNLTIETNSSFEVYTYLYDFEGTELDYKYSYSSSTISKELLSGTYYIETNNEGNDIGSYTLQTSFDSSGVATGESEDRNTSLIFYPDFSGKNFFSLFSNYIDSSRIFGEVDFESSNIQPSESDTLFNFEYKLDANSTLIDAGGTLDTGALIHSFGDLSTLGDIECNERVVGDAIDLGAFEFGGIDGNSCGVENNLSETSSELVKIESGWSLRAVDMNVSDIPVDVSIVWTYSNGNWSAFSPDGSMSEKITNAGFDMTTDTLSSENGTWFKSNLDFDLVIAKPETDFQTPTPPSLVAENLGWNLLGTARELPAEVISCQNGEKTLMWKFFQGEWLLFAPNINPSLYDLMFNTLLANEGFWVLCE
jgi:predicted outer membrane repeat protein